MLQTKHMTKTTYDSKVTRIQGHIFARIADIRKNLPAYYDAIKMPHELRHGMPETDSEIIETAILHYQGYIKSGFKRQR